MMVENDDFESIRFRLLDSVVGSDTVVNGNQEPGLEFGDNGRVEPVSFAHPFR